MSRLVRCPAKTPGCDGRRQREGGPDGDCLCRVEVTNESPRRQGAVTSDEDEGYRRGLQQGRDNAREKLAAKDAEIASIDRLWRIGNEALAENEKLRADLARAVVLLRKLRDGHPMVESGAVHKFLKEVSK